MPSALRSRRRQDQRNIVTHEGVLGVLSLILWALILVVTCKYVLILLAQTTRAKAARCR